MPTSEQTIATFIEDYKGEYAFYVAVARLASERCEKVLGQNGIRAVVTFRAKRCDRLEAKLRQRLCLDQKTYGTDEDIRNDIVDLSGVRISLFFPNDLRRVENLIRENFNLVLVKRLGREGSEVPVNLSDQRFRGYYADHYRVRLGCHDLRGATQRHGNALVEIQVATVLMHAWSEVNHDLGYKPFTGPASEDEMRILDGINGIVHAGEVFLEQLQVALMARISSPERKFTNHYELGSYLLSLFPGSAREQVVSGRLDILFEALRALRLDSPKFLNAKLEGWEMRRRTDPRVGPPLALSLLDHIFSSLDHGGLSLRQQVASGLRTSEDGSHSPWIKKRILENALITYDKLRHMETSSRLRDVPNTMRDIRSVIRQVISSERAVEDDLGCVNSLWDWFRRNDDINIRVAFGISRLSDSGVFESVDSDGMLEKEEMPYWQLHSY
ncbi:Uncharacterized protein HZ326_27306 [Fusarium oxysporum f. sp. albedinis]|nr:Uncharacterized protein HZ326_27306 [Fusarium oxysporum f. sp. albedinis]